MSCDPSISDVLSRFYYDFFNEEKKMTDSDLKLIKKEMDKIIRQKLPLLMEEVTRYGILLLLHTPSAGHTVLPFRDIA